jgi:hypothetical protein
VFSYRMYSLTIECVLLLHLEHINLDGRIGGETALWCSLQEGDVICIYIHYSTRNFVYIYIRYMLYVFYLRAIQEVPSMCACQ